METRLSVCPIFSSVVVVDDAIRRPKGLVHGIIFSSKARKASWQRKRKMASSSSMPEKTYHVRSTSLPSRSHPITLRVEDEINKLKTWVALASSSTSSLRVDMIHYGLDGLRNLYDCVGDFLQLPAFQQIITRHRHEKWVNELLDGFVMLLDVCGTTNDILVSMKEHVQGLLSMLRRRKGGESSMENKVDAYISLRKKVKKNINKCLVSLKRMDDKSTSIPIIDQDQDLSVVVRVQRESRAITISTFQAVLYFISSKPKPKPKLSKWSLVSKLMREGSITCEGEEKDMNEVRSVDAALFALYGHISSKDVEIETVQKAQRHLQALEIGIKDLEAGLECIFRCLIQTRVSLLNILTQ